MFSLYNYVILVEDGYGFGELLIMLLYRISEQIICNLDKNISTFPSVVRFSYILILDDISKPTYKHFFSNGIMPSSFGDSIIS